MSKPEIKNIELYFIGIIGKYLLLASKSESKDEQKIAISEAKDILGGFPLNTKSKIIDNLYDYLNELLTNS